VSALRPADVAGRRIVVVSPHHDDGVLSLGATIARWSREGAAVELLTVLGCDPGSEAPSGGWDARGGFATEGQAARGRRDEDSRACAVIGARPRWLPYGSVDYERHGDDADVRRAVAEAVVGADTMLVPGSPLTHPDHVWLVRTLGPARLGVGCVGLYAEQPYTRRSGRVPEVPAWVAEAFGQPGPFAGTRTGTRDRVAKWRAIRCYRSQLPLLGMHRSPRRGAHRYAAAAEMIAWVGDYPPRRR
jgi:LmbE family N-acetylglucosaminyl deacetylase